VWVCTACGRTSDRREGLKDCEPCIVEILSGEVQKDTRGRVISFMDAEFEVPEDLRPDDVPMHPADDLHAIQDYQEAEYEEF
jgi:hypothetical protein